MSEASKTGQVFFNRKGDQGKTGPLVYPAGNIPRGRHIQGQNCPRLSSFATENTMF